MEILPAIDLKDGVAVRLSKGLMDSAKIYSKTPWELAKKFEDFGAKYLHLVDLDGAFAGEAINYKTIEKIVKSTNLKVEVGGGIRDEKRIKEYQNLGVYRFILGSVALKNPNFVREVAPKYNIVVGIDAKGGMVAVEGWEKTSDFTAVEFAKKMVSLGVKTIVYTDIATDGTLAGPNVEAMREMADAVDADIIASGGIGSLEDILSLKDTGVEGVIVGKALYTNRVDLKEAVEKAR